MEFTIYDSDGGFVCSLVSSNAQVDPSMIPDGGFVIEGNYDRTTMFVSGQVVELSGTKLDEYNSELFLKLRSERNVLLYKSDWTQMLDSPLTEEQKQAWADYRQALRDLPANTTDPANPVWPTAPE